MVRSYRLLAIRAHAARPIARPVPDCVTTLPVNAGPLINTANFEGGPSLSQDGLTLLFGAARQNSLGQLDEDIYIATRETTSQPFGPPENLGAPVNSLGFGDYSPELSRDGLTLYFSSSRPGGLGQADLYVTTRESTDDPWEPPQNLGPNVNTPFFEGQPSISANGKNTLLGFGPAGRPWRLRYLDGDTGGGLRNLRASSQHGTSGEHSWARVRPGNQPQRSATVSSRRAGLATSARSTSGWLSVGRTRRGQVRGGLPSTSIP